MPKWLKIAGSALVIAAGAALCATGVGAGVGAGLMVAGGSMLASNIMDAAGVDSKLACQISAGLDIVGGTALCFVPGMQGMGASMIGSGVGSFAGGYISESLGGSYELGSTIGNLAGGFAGSAGYKLKSASKALTSGKPNQIHHFATNKNKKYTPQFERITKKYGLDLDGNWNKKRLPHQGRHPNAYHEYILEQMKKCDNYAKGNQNKFLSSFEKTKRKVVNNPDMLYKRYWNERR